MPKLYWMGTVGGDSICPLPLQPFKIPSKFA